MSDIKTTGDVIS